LAVELLQAVNKIAARIGLCFHVGSQCTNPESFRQALRAVGEVLRLAQVEIDVLDVGGGFPVPYPGMSTPPLGAFVNAIAKGVEELKLPSKCKLWCEPGRALVAEAGSLVVRVDLRKDNKLYINDGSYGALFDATYAKTRYPVRLIRSNGSTHTGPLKPFVLYGPTCDSLDIMPGPFMLPEDVMEGDWIEIGQTGAYSASMRTPFNGFDDYMTVELGDEPQLTTPDYVNPTGRRTVNKGSVLNLNRLLYLREAYETEMS
jgi:ornithine decarboxylase